MQAQREKTGLAGTPRTEPQSTEPALGRGSLGRVPQGPALRWGLGCRRLLLLRGDRGSWAGGTLVFLGWSKTVV